MTKEQKDLLLKELCARIPYGVKVNAPFTSNKKENTKGYKINGINFGIVEWTPILFGEKKRRDSIIIEAFSEKYNQYCSIDLELNNNIEEVKPYLFPLSSMTEMQRKEYESLCIKETSECIDLYGIIFAEDHYYDTIESIDYLYKNHIDIRGLIPKGLALDATSLNIY